MTLSPQSKIAGSRIAKPVQFWTGTALILAALAGVAYLLVFPHGSDAPYPGCLFNRVTGLYCVGCGTTRGINALVHGDIQAALSFNLLTISVGVATVIFAIHSVFHGITGRALIRFKVTLVRVVILIGLAFVFFVVRNLPIYPFTILAP